MIFMALIDLMVAQKSHTFLQAENLKAPFKMLLAFLRTFEQFKNFFEEFTNVTAKII
jgi:hypothetical protein